MSETADRLHGLLRDLHQARHPEHEPRNRLPQLQRLRRWQSARLGRSFGTLREHPRYRDAAEFLSKKDYADNWMSEMNEEFCFWSFSRWKQVLAETGFHVQENPNQPGQASRAYTNPWIIDQRYRAKVELLDLNESPLPWPPTNMVLVAEKLVT